MSVWVCVCLFVFGHVCVVCVFVCVWFGLALCFACCFLCTCIPTLCAPTATTTVVGL